MQLPPHLRIAGQTVLVRAFACCLGIMATAAWMSAGESGARKFDVPADLAEKSLRAFSVQSGSEVLFSSDAASGVRTNAIKGEFSPGEAVKKMLVGTNLYVRDERDGVFRIAATPRPKAPGAALNPGQNDRPGEAKSGARSRDPPPGTSSAAQPNQLQTSQPQHNESPPVKNRTLLSFLTGWLAAGTASDAQTKVIPSKEEVVTMSPFEVVSDNRGYYAANTTSGTRLSSRIEDLGASISVVTKEQMSDFAMLDINDIFNYEASTEGTGNYTDLTFDVYGSPVDNVERNPAGANRIRGLGAANITFGNFETSGRVPIDPLNIEGVEISRGPNSSIFGIGNSSGTVNSVPSSANLARNRAQVAFRVDNDGGHRSSLDLNRVIKPGTLAVRGSAAYQHDAYERKPSGVDSVRLNGMIKYRPFAKTTLSASYLNYRMHGTRPNATSARDGITGWIAAGSPTWDPYNRVAKLNGASLPYTGNFPAQYFWEKVNTYSLLHVEQNGITFWGGGRSTLSTTPMTANTGTVLRYLAPLPMASNPLQNQPFWVGYVPPLTDKGIYDWTSVNLAAANRVQDDSGMTTVLLDQVFIDTPRHSLALQAGWFRESNERYQFMPLSDTSQTQGVGVITVDVNERRLDGTPNPNFLRPYVAVAVPRPVQSFLARDTYRGQLVYKLDLRTEKSPWRWLGMHQMSGYAEYKHYEDWTRGYRATMVSQHAWLPSGVNRIGPSSVGGLPGGGQAVVGHYNFYLGDNTGYNVEYAPASFNLGTYPMLFGNPTTGFVREPVELGLAADTNGGTFTILKSRGAILQSNLLGDRLITTFGWRHDARYARNKSAILLQRDGVHLDPSSDRWANTNWSVGKGMTKTAGAVLRPVPWFGLYANTSDSFQPASLAQDLYRRFLPDPNAVGVDYGVMFNLFKGKLSLRLNQYRVEQRNNRNGTSTTLANRMATLDFYWRVPTGSNYLLQQKAGEWVQAAAAAKNETLSSAEFDKRVAGFMGLPVEFLTPPEAIGENRANATGAGTTAVDQNLSRGREIEINYNPVPSWTLKANITEQEAINSKVSAEVLQWYQDRMAVWTKIIDPVIGRPWFTERYNNSTSAAEYLATDVTSNLELARASEGKSKPQVRKYRVNASTSLKLAGVTDHPVLKRLTVGGAARWEDKGAIGYFGEQRLPAIITRLDVNRPIWDQSHLYVDLFGSYRTRIFSDKVAATIQLNVRSLNESGRLQPIAASPDGAATAYRLVDPRKFILSVTLDL